MLFSFKLKINFILIANIFKIRELFGLKFLLSILICLMTHFWSFVKPTLEHGSQLGILLKILIQAVLNSCNISAVCLHFQVTFVDKIYVIHFGLEDIWLQFMELLQRALLNVNIVHYFSRMKDLEIITWKNNIMHDWVSNPWPPNLQSTILLHHWSSEWNPQSLWSH